MNAPDSRRRLAPSRKARPAAKRRRSKAFLAEVRRQCRLANQAREAQHIIEVEARRILQQAELPRAGELVVLSAEALATSSRHLRAEVFRLIWTREDWPAGEMNFADWERLAALAESESGAADLPHGVRARRAARVVQLGPATAFPK